MRNAPSLPGVDLPRMYAIIAPQNSEAPLAVVALKARRSPFDPLNTRAERRSSQAQTARAALRIGAPRALVRAIHSLAVWLTDKTLARFSKPVLRNTEQDTD